MFQFLIEIAGIFTIIIVLIFFGLLTYLILKYALKKAKEWEITFEEKEVKYKGFSKKRAKRLK
ncbi:MAG: hypothetical protein QXS37_05450 [Candidatus Aenigmatarchaeota archaeon]